MSGPRASVKRKLAIPIMGVVGHRCPHCSQAIHEKSPGKWDESQRCFIHACGGSYAIKDSTPSGKQDERLFRGWLPTDAGHGILDPVRVALESLVRDVVDDADDEQTTDADTLDDVVGLSTRTYSVGKHGGIRMNQGAPSLTRRA